jgi:hypothetical protein
MRSLCLPCLIVALILAAGPSALGQDQPSPAPAEDPGAVAPAPDDERPSGTFCTNQDALFSARLTQSYLVLGGLITLFALPLLLPMLLGYRWWWLTRPLARWLVLGGGGWLIVVTVAVWFPVLTAAGVLPDWFLRLSYSTVNPDYLRCVDVPVQSDGVLWGLFGDPRRVVLAQDGAMWFGVLTVTALGTLLYWITFYLWRLLAGAPSWRRRED